MRGVVKKWGNNSAAVRIPASALEAVHVQLDQPVDVRKEEERIVIEPLRPPSYDLAHLALLWHLYDNRAVLYQAGISAECVLCPNRPRLAMISTTG